MMRMPQPSTAFAVALMLTPMSLSAAPAVDAPPTVRRAATARAVPPAVKTARKPTSRMLEDIQIEGEIPVPQVLFVTARDQRRFLEFHHRRYLANSLQLGQSTLLPTGVVVTRMPGDPGKETPR